MCLSCILLGKALSRLPTGQRCPPQFRCGEVPSSVGTQAIIPPDEHAVAYLGVALERLGTAGVELTPVQVDGDGNCLVHAVSRCLVGKEVLWAALRAHIAAELTEFSAWYIDTAGLLEADIQGCVQAATQDQEYLESVHVLALANVLRRPIFMLSPEAAGVESGFHGVFLPRRHTPAECREGGAMPPPIVLGFVPHQMAAGMPNHFVYLAAGTRNQSALAEVPAVASVVDLFNGALTGAGCVNSVGLLPTAEVACRYSTAIAVTVPEAADVGQTLKMPGTVNGSFKAIAATEGGTAPRCCVVSPLLELLAAPLEPRQRALQKLSQIFTAVDSRRNSTAARLAKACTVPLHLPGIQRDIVQVPGAVEMLLLAGFKHDTHPGEKDAKLAQKLGQLQPFIVALPQESMGQLASFGPT